MRRTHAMKKKPDYFDVHSHLNDAKFDADRDEAIARMAAANVWTITVGTDYESSANAAALAERSEGMFASAGIHPTDLRSELFDAARFEKLLCSPRVVAIGECGLDYFRAEGGNPAERARQTALFEAQLELAVRAGKPLMIHCRSAHDDMIDILRSKKRAYGEKLFGNIHFFTAPAATAKHYLDLGFTLSFSGVVTFAREYDDAVRSAPLSMIMAETDTPYAAPVPYRGKRNEPLYVAEIVRKIAEIRGESLPAVSQTLVENAFRVFGIETISAP